MTEFRRGDIVEVASVASNAKESWGMIGVVTEPNAYGEGKLHANIIVAPPSWKHATFISPHGGVILRGHTDEV